METAVKELFKVGDLVGVSGRYLCVPCGYEQYFEKGEYFTVCEACLAGTSDGPAGYEEPESEFWQLID